MFEEKILSKVGYIETTLPFFYYNQLLENINSNNFVKKDANSQLAGQIQKEFSLEKQVLPKEILKIIYDSCEVYAKRFKHKAFMHKTNKNYDYELLDVWINYQKKGEYNPVHHHSFDFVFVIWLKVPYNIEDEFNHSSSINSNGKIASCFQFVNVSSPLSITESGLIPVDKSYEGKMIVFHSEMEHLVYPFFTSDDYRISMSGNIRIVFEE